MKKCLFAIILLLGCIHLSQAKEAMQDIVYLKNGSVIRGVITGLVPDESVKIQTADGSIFVYATDDVAKITRENASVPSGKGLKKGYRGMIQGGYAVGKSEAGANHFEVTLTNGYQFNPSFFLGGGIGVHGYADIEKTLFIPIFLDFRAYFTERPVAPFLNLNVGYSAFVCLGNSPFSGYGFRGGLYLAPAFGVRFKLKGSQAIDALNLSLGYTLQQMYFAPLSGNLDLHSAALKFGIEF
ncbi:MAG: hypothetical protein PUB21_04685 [Bacteroidales bacterium]|nr:hypothetical protein [Bacteroidales bacterium]